MKTYLHVSGAVVGAGGTAFASSPLGQRLREQQASGSTSNRVIAEYLLRNPVHGTSLSIEDMAAACGVSAATLSRFAKALDFHGYPELRAALAEALQEVLRPVEKLRGALARQASDDPLRASLQDSLANLRATAEGLDPAVLSRAAQKVSEASCVYVLGFGLSAHLAALLTLGLQPFCRQLVNVVEYGGTEVAAGRLMNLEASDLLIAISFPRYAADAVHLTRFALDRGASIIALTDSIASPLAPHAGEVLIAQSSHPVLSSSNVSALLVIEALVTALMVSNNANVEKAARLTEAISAYLIAQPAKGR
ncbi:MAG: MurR/RpiR family transcriptional regulator [Methylobacterium sp.]|jgi:DNA-binding MurR/RpiR family transcriptional regulator|nr:MurR/RpiR family transcriptional regulator [Methylobacterium sp.]MCA3640402.1 MurR/RpiR family transcriptional regulator [Methylobacterium sp.]MCA3647334.1 MurR/RpiR family transcriptional regulator [Methylobacterium sp.]MCA3652545.1 MurR/RpiR family transcriptional regulator [Methylobacterium sp.]MCA4922446.1 MurR/RpiR family transcriptional regulator [Methylobacterium sp.]